MKTMVAGARLIDPARGSDRCADLWLADGTIIAVGDAPEAGHGEFQTIDGDGLWLFPAAVDLQADLSRGTAAELAAAEAGGIGHVCCAPSNANLLDSPALVEHLLREAAQRRVKVTPVGALTRGLEGHQLTDYAALKAAGCGALSNGDRAIADAAVLRSALRYATSLDMPVFLRPGDAGLGGGCAHEGPMATRLGLSALPAVAETAGLARDLELAADTGARVHFTRLSCARSVDLVTSAAADGLAVSADVAMAHLHLTDHDLSGFNALCHVQPPLRSTTDRRALQAAVCSGAIAAVCSDHRPLSADEKLAPFAATEPGISGLETLLALAMRLVDDGTVELHRMLASLSTAPARILGQQAPAFEAGANGRWCLWDPGVHWRPQDYPWMSLGRNCPFMEWELKGRVVALL